MLSRIVSLVLAICNICHSAPNWAYTLPAIRNFINTGNVHVNGHLKNYNMGSLDILTASNDWTMVDYTYGPGPAHNHYKARVMVHYVGYAPPLHPPLVGHTTWEVYIQTPAVTTAIETLIKKHNKWSVRNTAPDISVTATSSVADEPLKCTITSYSHNPASTTAHIDTVGKTATIAIQRRNAQGNYVDFPANPQTGKAAMDLIMNLLVTQFQITGQIDLLDASSKACQYGAEFEMPYGIYNAFHNREGYYSQWHFRGTNGLQPQITAALQFINTLQAPAHPPLPPANSLGALWHSCPNGDAGRNVIKNKVFPMMNFDTYLGNIGANSIETLAQFMSHISRCDDYKTWTDFWKQTCGSINLGTMIVVCAGGQRVYDQTPVGFVGPNAKYQEMNYYESMIAYAENEPVDIIPSLVFVSVLLVVIGVFVVMCFILGVLSGYGLVTVLRK